MPYKERDAVKERAWQQNSYARNREKILARKRERYDAVKKSEYNSRPDRKDARKKYYEENKSAHQLRVRRRKQKLELIRNITDEQWLEILERYGHKCLACGSIEDITRDHVVPISKGGEDTPENSQPLCRSCNSSKGTKIVDYRTT